MNQCEKKQKNKKKKNTYNFFEFLACFSLFEFLKGDASSAYLSFWNAMKVSAYLSF